MREQVNKVSNSESRKPALGGMTGLVVLQDVENACPKAQFQHQNVQVFLEVPVVHVTSLYPARRLKKRARRCTEKCGITKNLVSYHPSYGRGYIIRKYDY